MTNQQLLEEKIEQEPLEDYLIEKVEQGIPFDDKEADYWLDNICQI